ncbi:MAG: thermonuclease family protein [Candidatus Omnitrophica bacterium]|nr:thermonuclease family protein [Candidatus Omnitrophota bacterium]
MKKVAWCPFLLIIILSVVLASCTQANYTDILVTKVFDGDTLWLTNGEKVRLIGIDTPEMYESDKLHRDVQRTGEDIETLIAMGRESYKFTKKLVEGRKVMLEFDVEKRDKYGRLLAYVFIPNRQLFLNAEILKQGYAEVMIIPPNLKYGDYFQGLYQEARENKRGLWSNNQ